MLFKSFKKIYIQKVTFLGAKLDKPETGLFCDYNFTFQIENKSEEYLVAFIYTPNFGVNGMFCSSKMEDPYFL